MRACGAGERSDRNGKDQSRRPRGRPAPLATLLPVGAGLLGRERLPLLPCLQPCNEGFREWVWLRPVTRGQKEKKLNTENIQTTSVKTLAEYRQVRDELVIAKSNYQSWCSVYPDAFTRPYSEKTKEGVGLNSHISALNNAADFFVWNYRTPDGHGVNREQLDAIADEDALNNTTVLPNGLTAEGNAEEVADLSSGYSPLEPSSGLKGL